MTITDNPNAPTPTGMTAVQLAVVKTQESLRDKVYIYTFSNAK